MESNLDATKSILYLNYTVYIDYKNERLLSKNRNLEDNNSVKNKIRYGLGNKLSRKLDSVGSSYVLPKVTARKEVDRDYSGGIFVGKGKKIENSIIRIPAGIRVIINADEIGSTEKIWNQVAEKAKNSVQIEVNRNSPEKNFSMMEETATVKFEEPTKYDKIIRRSGDGLPSYIPEDKNEINQIEKEIESRVGNSIGMTETPLEEDSIKPSNLPNKTEEELLSDIEETTIQNIKKTVEEKEVTPVRKPTEDEFERIIDRLIERLHKISDIHNPVYIEEVPDGWKAGTCSRCDTKSDQINMQLNSKSSKVLTEQMKEGFGIASKSDEENARREYINEELTNFMLDSDGKVYFQSQEVISWIVDISHYVEAVCGECHREYGGGKHTKFISVTTDKNTEDSNNNTLTSFSEEKNEYETQPEILENKEQISIETDDVGLQKEFKYYRPPEKSEVEYVLDAISEYLFKLCTREYEGERKGDVKNRRQTIYRIIHKRKNRTGGISSKVCRCSECSTPIGDGNFGHRKLQRHHIEPKRLQKFKIKLMRETRDIDTASILVNDRGNDYILKDQFFRRLEMLVKNIDTFTVLCQECNHDVSRQNQIEPEEVTETEQKKIDSKYEATRNASGNKKRQDININQIHEIIKPQQKPKNIEFTCYRCLEKYEATYQSNKYYQVRSNSAPSYKTPIIDKRRLNTDFWSIETKYIGCCGNHRTLQDDISEHIDTDKADAEQIYSTIKVVISKIYK
jgi:hypothetical protein